MTKQESHYQNDRTYLFKMVYSKPYFSLGIKHTTQVAPGHGKVWLGLNGFQVTSLQWIYIKTTGKEDKR